MPRQYEGRALIPIILQLRCQLGGLEVPMPRQYAGRYDKPLNTAASLPTGGTGGSIYHGHMKDDHIILQLCCEMGLFNTAASPRIIFTLLNAAQPFSTLLALLAAARSEGVKVQEGGSEGGEVPGCERAGGLRAAGCSLNFLNCDFITMTD